MPTVNHAYSEMERFLGQARASHAALSNERGALRSEASRIHREIARRFRTAIAGRFENADDLLGLDAGHGDPLRLSERMETLRGEAERARREHRAHMGKAVAAPAASEIARADEKHSAARSAWDAAARARDVAERVLSQFDPRFLQAHRIIVGTAVGEDALKAPSLLARTLNLKVMSGRRALKNFLQETGTSYWDVRDSVYRQAVERGETAVGEERSAWAALESAEGEASALRHRHDVALEHVARADALDRAASASEATLRSPMEDLGAHAGSGLEALLGAMTEEAVAGKPGRATTAVGRLAGDGLIGPGDVALAGHAVSLRKAADRLGKPIRDMDGLVSKLSAGKDKLAKAKRQGAGSKHVSIDLSAIEGAIRAGGSKIDSVLNQIGRMRTPESASVAMMRGLGVQDDFTTNAMLIFWMLQVEGATQPTMGIDLIPNGLDDANLSGLGAGQAFSVASVDVPNVTVDVPSVSIDIPTISVDVPAISVDIPTISVDMQSMSFDSNY